PFFLTQAFAPSLRTAASKDQPAKVINVASIDGIRPNPQETYSYQASKAGLIHLTRRMAARLIADNICVNAIAPAAFASEMNRAAAIAVDGQGAGGLGNELLCTRLCPRLPAAHRADGSIAEADRDSRRDCGVHCSERPVCRRTDACPSLCRARAGGHWRRYDH